jgi:hypothetical protein
MIRVALDRQHAHRNILGEIMVGFPRRENGDVVPERPDPARNVDAITLKAAAGKQADDCEREMHLRHQFIF